MTLPDSAWQEHLAQLRACRRCPAVFAPPVVGAVPGAAIYLMGQAPGPTEQQVGRPFAAQAGRTLFRWFASLGVTEERFRAGVFMGAVIRCFPGKVPGKQGDRKPAQSEVQACAPHFETEFRLLSPQLVIPVGKLAIERLVTCRRLDEVVGRALVLEREGRRFTCIPLPHPSGLSRWIQGEPGKNLLAGALHLISEHAAWRRTFPP